MKKYLLPLAAAVVAVFAVGAAVTTGRYAAPKIAALADSDEPIPNYYPDKATGMSASFEDGAVTGTFTFTTPSTMAGGNAPVGWLKYEIYEGYGANKQVYGSGDCEYGKTYTVPITVAPGYHTVTVTLSNAKGTGSPAYPNCTFWAGPGTPSNPKDVVLTSDGNTVTVTWSAVTTPTNSIAFFKPEEVTYKVVRTPDDVVVSASQSETTYTGSLPEVSEPTGFRFNVIAMFRDQESAAVSSNGVAIGTATPAWECTLNTINNFDLFGIIDGNGDGKTWKYPSYGTAPVLEKGSGKDDWLATPGLEMLKGYLYPVEVTVASYGANYTETFEVKGGTAATAEGLSSEVIEATAVCTADRAVGMKLKGFYTAEADGINYIGVHAMTASATYDAYILEVKVGAGIAPAAPEAVEALSAISDPDVEPATAEITLTAPSTSIDGEALSSLTKIELSRNGVLIHTFDNPAPGSTLSFSDVVEEKGVYTYAAVAVNEPGAGRVAETSTFVGDYRLHPPYSCDFSDKTWLDSYTVINTNNDSYKWEHDSSGYAACSSSSTSDRDYLILPAVWLKAGYRYTFSFQAMSYWDSDQVPFEVLFGTSADGEGLSTLLGEVKGADSKIGKVWNDYSFTVDIEESAQYYFAICYTSSGYSCKLCIDNVAVSEGLNVGAPQAITDFAAVPDFGGALKTEISFTAPSQSMAGTELSENLSKIELTRDGEVINTFEEVAPGAELTWTDEAVEAGYHTYAVTRCAKTKGETSSTRVYVGANIPGNPSDASVVESTTGTVTISWTAPELDIDGNELNPALVSYKVQRLSIYGSEPETVAEGITEPSYTYAAVAEGKQNFVGYRVVAVTAGGESEGCADTDFIPVGTPHTLPMVDSFSEGTMAYEYIAERLNEYPSEWMVYSNRDLANLEDQDDTNGVMGVYAPYTVAQSHLATGKVSLEGATHPQFSIWYRAVQDSQSSVGLDVREVGSEEYTRLTLVPCWDANTISGWVKVAASLDDFVGKTVQLAVFANQQSQNYLFFDNMRIAETHDADIRANSITAPARMYAGEDAPVKVFIQNVGENTVAEGAYSVELICNGEKVQTLPGQLLNVDQKAVVEFIENHSADVEDEEFVYSARVVFEADGDLSDNATEETHVAFIADRLPGVVDLSAKAEPFVNVLTWSAPEIQNASTTTEAVTDDFESYESFAKADLDDWLLVDADGEKFAGFSGLSLPGISGEMAYFVLDNTYSEISYDPYGALTAHSGNKYLVSACTEGPSMASDDWLISPQISQSCHSISFYAKSYDGNYLETFEVLYSLDSRSTDDFKRIRVYSDVPTTWKKYDITLPEGTRYFAIRCLSVDKFMFFVDDITYTPMVAETEALVVKGYHVYRDGVQLTSTPVSDTSYVDATATPGSKVSYTVRTVYAQGESMLSNEASVTTAGLSSVAAGRVSVKGGDNCVIVEGATDSVITVVTPDGRTVARAIGTARTVIDAPEGIVLVTVGTTTSKVIVK